MQTLYITRDNLFCFPYNPIHKNSTMEFSLSHKNVHYCFPNPISKTKATKHPSTLPCHIFPRGLRAKASNVVAGCANKSEIERGLEAERWLEEGAEWLGVGKLREKCGEGREGGAVEALECLEREAIMGEDEGKEPNDYNRRAQIFYKSSRVFQELKESASNE